MNKKDGKILEQYSGECSHEFWNTINSLEGKDHDAAYSMGVMLQDLESRVLLFINEKIKGGNEHETS